LDEPRYAEAARTSAAFIESRMHDSKTGLLKRRYRDGAVEIDAVLEDYAFLIQGLLDAYETSFEVKWLSWAMRCRSGRMRCSGTRMVAISPRAPRPRTFLYG
jgi:uncharacterized protein YyaL (SSP411 family)